MAGLLDSYKRWVRAHPGIVQNLDWLLYLTVWNPARTSSTGGATSEVQYEAYHACVGLLSVWHQHLIEEDELPVKKPSAALWMEALEQVETIIELRSMHLEDVGKMSRYAPLVALESVKSFLKMLMWSQYSGHLYLRHPTPEDIAHFEAEQGFQDVLSALERLRTRYTSLSDCSAAATHDVMGQLSAVTQPLRAAVQPLLHWLKLSQQTKPTSSSSDCGSTSQGSTGLEVEPMLSVNDSSSKGSSSGSHEQQQSIHGGGAWGKAQTSRTRRASSAPGRGVGGVDVGVGLDERPQGPGLSLHVFCDERAGMNLIWLGEMLHIWRPVIYVWMLYRYGRRSWRPWWASLAVDLLSRHFSRRGRLLLQRSAGKTAGPRGSSAVPAASKQQHAPTSLLSVALVRGLSVHQLSAGEERELDERRRKLAMYLLRSPFYNQFVKPPAEALQWRTAHMPVLGSCIDYVAGLLETFTKYYTYTSSSS